MTDPARGSGGPVGAAGHRDGGFATAFACMAAVVLLAVTVMAIRWGAADLARHRAESAADLAALAGAGRALEGVDAACAQAGATAAANSARVASCRLAGLDVLLEVQVAAWNGVVVTAHARAGPADDEVSP